MRNGSVLCVMAQVPYSFILVLLYIARYADVGVDAFGAYIGRQVLIGPAQPLPSAPHFRYCHEPVHVTGDFLRRHFNTGTLYFFTFYFLD